MKPFVTATGPRQDQSLLRGNNRPVPSRQSPYHAVDAVFSWGAESSSAATHVTLTPTHSDTPPTAVQDARGSRQSDQDHDAECRAVHERFQATLAVQAADYQHMRLLTSELVARLDQLQAQLRQLETQQANQARSLHAQNQTLRQLQDGLQDTAATGGQAGTTPPPDETASAAQPHGGGMCHDDIAFDIIGRLVAFERRERGLRATLGRYTNVIALCTGVVGILLPVALWWLLR